MMKISIKREQSQAGLSFAERKKFRPQVKNKLLLLLALLLTAATGAWAQTTFHKVTSIGVVALEEINGVGTGCSFDVAKAWVEANQEGLDKGDYTFFVYNVADGSYNTVVMQGSSVVGSSYPLDGATLASYLIAPNGVFYALGDAPAQAVCDDNFVRLAGDVSEDDLKRSIVSATDEQVLAFMRTLTKTGNPQYIVRSYDESTSTYSIYRADTGQSSSISYADLASYVSQNSEWAFYYLKAVTYTVTLAAGTQDAKNWSIASGEKSATGDAADGLTGLSEGDQVTLTYTGRLKVKGVKATSDAAAAAKEPATVTTAPTGAAVVGVGKETALVSGGEAEGGTLMYAVTTTNTKPTSTDGFSGTVPTAQTITASGTVYVWYYVKGDDTHSDSEIAATPIEVPVADIVWDATNVFNSSHQDDRANQWNPGPLTYEGITISVSGEEGSTFVAYDPSSQTGFLICYGDEGDSFTFTAPSGMKFCKIEIINNDESTVFDDYGDWTRDETGKKFVWSGTAANAVTLGTVYTVASNLNSIAFYLSE